MTNEWLNFALVVFIQLLLFLVHAYSERRLADVPRILWQSALCGVIPGLLCDLIFGKYLGLATYTLGFGPIFLILNAVLLYGLFVANILLMQRARMVHFCTWISTIVATYEITNVFFRLWTYPFAVPSVEYVIVAFVFPLGFAVVVAGAMQAVLGYRFAIFDSAADGKFLQPGVRFRNE